jgi:hypothetical protein
MAALDDDAIRESDWNRLTPEAKAWVRMLVGLREGRTVKEAAERMAVVVDAVIDNIVEDDKGKISGPKGNMVLTLEVGPNTYDGSANTVVVREKLGSKWPEDRHHVLYVGKGSTLHTRQATTGMLFAVEDGAVVDAAAATTTRDDPHRNAAQAD